MLTRTTAGAIADFRRWEGTREVWADLDGHFRLSQRRLHRRVRILGIENVSTLIVLDPESNTIHTVGPNETANVYPSGIVAQPGRPVTVDTRPVTLTQRLLRELLREVPPDGETYFHGIVRTPDAVALKPDPEAYEVLKPGLQALELRFARPRDLEAPELRGVFVLEGHVLVQTIRPDGHAPRRPAPPRPPPGVRVRRRDRALHRPPDRPRPRAPGPGRGSRPGAASCWRGSPGRTRSSSGSASRPRPSWPSGEATLAAAGGAP